MFSLKSTADYTNNHKSDLVLYLKNEVPRSQIGSDEISLFLSKFDECEKSVNELNSLYRKIEQKYFLLFSLRDFRSLFQDKLFIKEMLEYIKYKEESNSKN